MLLISNISVLLTAVITKLSFLAIFFKVTKLVQIYIIIWNISKTVRADVKLNGGRIGNPRGLSIGIMTFELEWPWTPLAEGHWIFAWIILD